MAYIDLDELPTLAGGALLRRRPGVLRFRRSDYHGPREMPLQDAVRETVGRATGHRPDGPIRLLANLRSFGHCFNPVSFYYCFERRGRLDAVLAEVTNTPWGERHAYVIPGGAGCFEKAMHVSPFLGMDHTYAAQLSPPRGELRIVIESRCDAEPEPILQATLLLRRAELNARSLRGFGLRYPLSGMRVLALIYGHAIGLRLAGVPVFAHPGGSSH